METKRALTQFLGTRQRSYRGPSLYSDDQCTTNFPNCESLALGVCIRFGDWPQPSCAPQPERREDFRRTVVEWEVKGCFVISKPPCLQQRLGDELGVPVPPRPLPQRRGVHVLVGTKLEFLHRLLKRGCRRKYPAGRHLLLAPIWVALLTHLNHLARINFMLGLVDGNSSTARCDY